MMEGKNKNKKEKITEYFNIIRNMMYLTTAKAIIVFLITVLVLVMSSNCLEILTIYLKSPECVSNVYSQSGGFNYETSVPFKAEMKKCFDCILQYSLKYSDIENYKFNDSIQLHIDDENNRAKEQIRMVKYLAADQIEENKISSEYIKNGFINYEKNPDGTKKAVVNKKKIEEYYNKVRDDLIDGYKKSFDDDYRKVAEYIESLDGVKYAVVDNKTNIIYSNVKNIKKENLKRIFSESENCLMFFNSKNPYYAATALKDFSTEVEELADDYEQNFDFYISFNNGLYFNERCTQFEQEHNDMSGVVFNLSFKGAASLVVLILLSVYLVSIAGKREYKGSIKYCITDKIPNDIHFLFHSIIVISMIMLMDNSFYFIFSRGDTTGWLVLNPNYYILRLDICCVALVLTALSFICCVKRQLKNGTLYTNTVIQKFLRVFRDKNDSDNETPMI